MPPVSRRRQSRESVELPTPTSESPTQATVPPALPASEPTLDRVTIPLTPDGTIAWDRMRASTQETVRKLIGVQAPSASAFDPMIVNALYDAVGLLAANIARATRHTVESSKRMLFTVEEKAAFLQPTQRVLDKYASQISKWQDELMLTMLVGVTLQQKIAQLEREPAEVVPFPQKGDSA